MIGPLVNALTSNTFQTIAQNTDACVKIETSLKAIGRPAFTLMDKNTDKETRKYAASKELLYQLLCFGIYVAVIPPIFKKYGFKLSKKIFKNENLPDFKNVKQVLAYNRLAHMDIKDRFLDKNKKFMDLIKNDKTLTNPLDNNKHLYEYLEKYGKGTLKNTGKMFELTKGSIEFSSIIGSVVGLTILAPEVSHLILHPIMNALNMSPKTENKNQNQQQKNLDKSA